MREHFQCPLFHNSSESREISVLLSCNVKTCFPKSLDSLCFHFWWYSQIWMSASCRVCALMETVWILWAASGACVNLDMSLTLHSPHAYVSSTVTHFLPQFLKTFSTSNLAVLHCTETLWLHYICMLVTDMQMCAFISFLSLIFPITLWHGKYTFHYFPLIHAAKMSLCMYVWGY